MEKKTGRSYGRGNPNKKWGGGSKWDDWDAQSWASDGSKKAKKSRTEKRSNAQPRAVVPLSIEEKMLGPGVKKAKKKRSKEELDDPVASKGSAETKTKKKRMRLTTGETGT